MRKLTFLVCVSCLTLTLCSSVKAQNRSICFEEGSFAEALAKAQQENKMVFMDCYTAWCGPCKLLAKNVFTVDSVADFFNAHFVNVKMDMEKGDGVELQKKYGIEAYPTLLLLDAKGEEVYRTVGGCSAPELLQNMRLGMNPENSIRLMESKFAAGEREVRFVRQYFAALKRGHQEKQLKKATDEYFKEMPVKQICEDGNWDLYNTYVKDIDAPVYHRLVAQIDEFRTLKGDSLIEKKLVTDYEWVVFNCLANSNLTEEQFRQYSEDVKNIRFLDPKHTFYLNSYLELAHLKADKQYDRFLDIVEAGPEGYEPERRLTIAMCLAFLADGTPQQRQRAQMILIREAKAEIQRNGKLAPNTEQVMGYIQFRLNGGKLEK